jgi:hypothetical protein
MLSIIIITSADITLLIGFIGKIPSLLIYFANYILISFPAKSHKKYMPSIRHEGIIKISGHPPASSRRTFGPEEESQK